LGLACCAALALAQPAQPPPPAPPASTSPVAKQPRPKSQKEVEAIQAMFNAQDPDGRIQAAETLITKFADTEFKALALQIAAMSAQQKNDVDKMLVYAERALEADPASYQSMLMIATSLAQRTREHDLDKEEKLGKSEKLAKESIALIAEAPRPRPDITDEQWTGVKRDFTAQAHEALGLAAMARKKYDVAIAEFKLAVEGATQPDTATMVRLGAVYNLAGKYDDAIAILDKVMVAPDLHPTIRQFAQAEKVRATQAKAGAAKTGSPAAPANAPAQVEIKKQ